ncbi:MAG: RagB/SusD family nutrient uptake outer membrane protein [Muribaculaceae bacterium]|nr:RagB/SusD family nutrient uptake outer membrane protein [Muribaculaceae bacterium]
MNKYISALIIGGSVLGFSSCTDFLDKMPESSIVPENFFQTADQLGSYAINFYGNFPVHDQYTYSLGTFILDNGTDNQVGMNASTIWDPSNNRTPTGDGSYWSFTGIRNANYFFDQVLPKYEAGQISGGDSMVDEYIGEMYFFRAYLYWLNYKEIGDFPIILTALPDDEEVLLEASVRYPRNQVARQILDDLAKAIQLLPETTPSTIGKQRLNRACAQLLRSRVALFEGTWLKYHAGTALVPGGPGWPGDQSMLNGFDINSEIRYFLQEAMSSAQPVADALVNNLAENTGTEDGYSASGAVLNPYYAMFTEQDLSNYDEVLLYKQYNLSQSIYNMIYMQFQRNGGNSGWTRGMVNSFVMQNGLPFYAAGSGYDPNWENQGVTATLQNRDSRIQIFTKGDQCITCYTIDGDVERFQEGWLTTGTSETRLVTGFGIKKGMVYTPNPGEHNHGVQGSIVFRGTEALLNYMEACVELNGTPDNNASNYWQALRRRAMVDPDFNKTIGATDMNQEALWDWGAYSAGGTVSPTLYNVRRERRCELSAEGFRMDDLRRWRSLDQLASNPYQIEGIKFWGTVYDISAGVNPLNLMNSDGKPLGMVINGVEYNVDENSTNTIVDVAGGTGNMSDQAISGDYVHPYQISALNNPYFDGLRFTPALYLSPIGQSAFRKASPDKNEETSVIYQNPGWSKIGGTVVGTIQ